ncbi:PH domain-containing protein [Candidatus Parabeggiatoa sp. HSG14]|uniref:PH domain-containing protein n=1 Tax=Candidatus Parabeggiatoa sp. HSG14 TaxID=3055593 RepID=UPI0025A6FD76|nr:PH domain-containing protein [Thiotrichales bacterium HSG14]
MNKEKKAEEVLYCSTPAMFRNRPFLFISCLIMVFLPLLAAIGTLTMPTGVVLLFSVFLVSIGGMVLFFWWLKVVNTQLAVTNERVTFRTGILSKNIREIFLSDIRSVQISQTLLQRILGTGWVEIASAASSEAEITIDGIPQAYEVKRIIDENRRQLRNEKEIRETNE